MAASSAGPLPPNKPLTNIASKKGGVCPKTTELDVVINVATATATTGTPYRRAADGSFHRRRRSFPIILGLRLLDSVRPKRPGFPETLHGQASSLSNGDIIKDPEHMF